MRLQPGAKNSELLAMWKSRKQIYPFASDVYRAGHATTNFDRWMRSSSEYQIRYQKGYEPWFIGAR
ncbi:hypothetical protein PLESTM_001535800 [Pleodorina starrii]|nr:hypothetical protein PLESTM_001535800 [Pleodorina starrii]